MLLRSTDLNVFCNLAIEEYLLDHVDDLAPVLFLWRSSNAVVIGKNQIPWRECDVALMEKEGCSLARRVSGGGAVYHDEGNLNFAFFVPRKGYRDELLYSIVIDALAELGVPAEMMGKNSIAVEGKKVSGNAFALRRNAAMHHGTLLVSSNLEKLGRYLKSGDKRFESHAVASIPAAVTNVAAIDPAITVDRAEEALALAFAGVFGKQAKVPVSDLDQSDLTDLIHRYAGWEWQFGKTPKFDFRSENGTVTVEHAVIIDAPPDQEARVGTRFEGH